MLQSCMHSTEYVAFPFIDGHAHFSCDATEQGRSQPKCDGGASQLGSTVANLYAIHQYGPIKLFTLYFLNKVHCNLLMHEALATVSAAW